MKGSKPSKLHTPYSPWEIILLLCVVALGFGLRYYGLGRQGLWADELFGITTSYAPHFVGIIPQLIADSHPPGYLSFLYFYVPFFDGSEVQLRLHSLLAGTLLVLLTHIFGRRYFSVTAGLIAAVLVAVNYQAIYYSQEARAYAMLSVTCLASLYYFLGFLLDGTATARHKILFIVFSSLSMYLHYNGVVWVGCLGVIYFIALCIRRWRREFLIGGIQIFGACGLLFLPWAKTMYHHMEGFSDYWGARQVVDISTLIHLNDFLFSPYWLKYGNLFFVGGWAICLIVSLQILLPKRFQLASNTQLVSMLTVTSMAVMPIAVFYIKSKISMPVFQERHFVVLIPLFMLSTAAPIAYFFEKLSLNTIRYTVLALILGALGWKQTESNLETGLYRLYTKDAIREAFDVVLADKPFMDGTNPMVLTTHWQMGYYLRKSHFPEIGNAIYAKEHYQHLAQDLIKAGSFYFVSINPAEQHPSLTASMEEFNMACRRELQTRSGIVSVVKMVVKTGIPAPATTECAPALKFSFPIN